MKRVQSSGKEALKALGIIETTIPPDEAAEAATLVATARVLMNLDEFVNRQ